MPKNGQSRFVRWRNFSFFYCHWLCGATQRSTTSSRVPIPSHSQSILRQRTRVGGRNKKYWTRIAKTERSYYTTKENLILFLLGTCPQTQVFFSRYLSGSLLARMFFFIVCEDNCVLHTFFSTGNQHRQLIDAVAWINESCCFANTVFQSEVFLVFPQFGISTSIWIHSKYGCLFYFLSNHNKTVLNNWLADGIKRSAKPIWIRLRDATTFHSKFFFFFK